jgi:FG-GAP-like repeat
LLVRPAYAIDLDGNGRPDLLQPKYVNGRYIWRYRMNLEGALGPWLPTTIGVSWPSDTASLDPHFGQAIDPTGSGRLGLMTDNGTIVRLGAAGLEEMSMTLAGDPFCEPQFIDLNGDGLLDWIARGSGADIGIAINTGNGFRAPITWTLPAAYAAAYPSHRTWIGTCDGDRVGGSGVRVADINDDGRQDLLLMAGYPFGGAGCCWRCSRQAAGSCLASSASPLARRAAPASGSSRRCSM